jgi:hypothetical protein
VLGVAVSPPPAGPDQAAERGAAPLDDSFVGRLQAVRDYPCASVLMTTAPAERMSHRDATRLESLVAAAGRRMVAEAPHHTIEPVLARLQRLAEEARARRTGRAIALFASDDHDAVVVLPIPVVDRVVVDPTFATRDLVRSLARHPRVRVVVVSEVAVRVLEGWSGQLAEVGIDGLTTRPPVPRRVAELVAARHREDPLPLVVAGVGRRLAAWKEDAVLADAIIGTIAGSHDDTSVARLDELSRPAVDEHLRNDGREALARVAAESPDRCAFGIDAVWEAAGAGRIDLLCVEDGYSFAARPARDGNRLEPADRIEHPAVLDDAVDEIIEMVHRGGGRVVTVRDGALAECGAVAALLRAGPGGPVSGSGSSTAG